MKEHMTIPTEKKKKRPFKECRDEIGAAFLAELDLTITHGKIATLTQSTGGVKVTWTKRLRTTAGRTNWRGEWFRVKGKNEENWGECKHGASIELAEKVVTDEHRLINVLAHEFCHLATIMISGVMTNSHGEEFIDWGEKVMREFAERGVEVTIEHNFDIDYRFVWECVVCGVKYERYSKSVDVERQSCRRCRGWLAQTKPLPRRNGNGYKGFVQKWFGRVRRDNPNMGAKEVTRVLANMYIQVDVEGEWK